MALGAQRQATASARAASRSTRPPGFSRCRPTCWFGSMAWTMAASSRVPMSPQTTEDGLHFNWGCAFRKKENKKQLGYVFGQLHEGYLAALTSKISDLAYEFQAERVLVMGYSMGGFGAFQLGGFSPDAFDAVISVAGYGLGTNEPESRVG
ncbi:unnamed protein product [Effrenium voratum]|nr:unnamed protein product [Effrenium voratum]